MGRAGWVEQDGVVGSVGAGYKKIHEWMDRWEKKDGWEERYLSSVCTFVFITWCLPFLSSFPVFLSCLPFLSSFPVFPFIVSYHIYILFTIPSFLPIHPSIHLLSIIYFLFYSFSFSLLCPPLFLLIFIPHIPSHARNKIDEMNIESLAS